MSWLSNMDDLQKTCSNCRFTYIDNINKCMGCQANDHNKFKKKKSKDLIEEIRKLYSYIESGPIQEEDLIKYDVCEFCESRGCNIYTEGDCCPNCTTCKSRECKNNYRNCGKAMEICRDIKYREGEKSNVREY